MMTSIGFANLPHQIHRKAVKKGFDFTVMVVGESGLGKSTLINCLFNTSIKFRDADEPKKFVKEDQVKIKSHVVDIDDKGVKLKLTVVSTDGFGDGLDSSKSAQPISKHIDDQFERYFEIESGIHRSKMVDNRVHCCFYFISPDSWSVTPLDISLMSEIHRKVNIVPLIAKADSLTPSELKEKKKRIIRDLEAHGISTYSIPEEDDDADYKNVMSQLKSAMPFGVTASLETHEVRGKQVLGRKYPTGIHEIENPDHSDFSRLKTLIVTHMQDMRDVTHEVHYENFRAQRIQSGYGMQQNKWKASAVLETSIDDENFDSISTCTSQFSVERERQLREKEIELQKMAEKIKLYEEQMKIQQQMFQQKQLQHHDE